MFNPAGDTIIIEKEPRKNNVIALPDNVGIRPEDVFVVKDVGIGYVTDQGVIIPPEVKPGDRVIIKGKVLHLRVDEQEIMLARAQDVLCFERSA